MEKQKEYCENLYRKYRELEVKTNMKDETISSGKEFNPPHIKSEDLLQRKKIVQEIKEKCKKFLDLKPEKWFEIEKNN